MISIALGSGAYAQQQPELVSSAGPRDPIAERSGFHLPPGFEIQLVASDPDIHKPLNMAFDDLGRLWVTETIEYPFPAKPGTTPRDCVKVLSDFGPDGKAKSIVTFADGLNIPIGLMPLPGGREALVHSIPSVDRFIDRDGDGKSDAREVAYKTFGSRDTHGMTNAFTWGFDGWIYACHGFSNNSEIRGKDGKVMTLVSGNVYRFRPDGSHAEQFTHGQVNPFGLSFDPMGNLYSADCHSKPVYMLLRNASYPTFGKPTDGLGLGPEMVSHDHGSTAISGVVYYAADQFPEPWRGTVFIGNVVTNRINHDKIDWHGSTPKGILQPDFLTSDDPWFRPVDLKLGPDGALYIADFYNRIIGHYEVALDHPGRDRERGRIWRIVYKGVDGKSSVPTMPNIAGADVSTLASMLASPNLTVRTLATNQLVSRGGTEVIGKLKAETGSASEAARVHSLWALARLDALDEETLKDAMKSDRRDVRIHARTIVAEQPHPAPSVEAAAREGLKDADGFVRRASADALGRHPEQENVRALLDARHAAPADDAQLIHMVRMALRDQFVTKAVWPVVGDNAHTEADYLTLADIAMGVGTAESARFVLDVIRRYNPTGQLALTRVHYISRYGADGILPALVSFASRLNPADKMFQADLIKEVHLGLQERGAAMNPTLKRWATEVAGELVSAASADQVARGAELIGSMGLIEKKPELLAVLSSPNAADSSRIAAGNALATLDPKSAADNLGAILANPQAAPVVAEAFAIALAKTNQETARAKLVELLPTASSRLQTTIAAALGANRAGAEALLAAIETGKASARLLQERAVRIYVDGSGVPDLAKRIETLTAGFPPAEAKIAALIDARRAAFAKSASDVAKGEQVFRTNCAACHQIAGQGARIGPQLDGIGVRGTERLLEDILDPNRNIDQAFRLTSLGLNDGRVISGLFLREDGDVLVMADNQGKEVRVPKGTVEIKKVTPISPMPADFGEKIAEPDFLNLLKYLDSRKEGKPNAEAKPAGTPK